MKIAIMVADSNGCYPVPASKGGAISTLVEHLLKNNEFNKKADIVIVTYYDDKAYQLSKKYINTRFIWIRIPKIIEKLDKMSSICVCKMFPKKKSLSFRSMFALIYYTFKSNSILKKEQFDKIIIENNMIAFNMFRGLKDKYKDKYYLHLHNIPRTTGGAKKIIQNCKSILCVSDYVGVRICSQKNSIGPIYENKIEKYFNCIDSNLFRLIDKSDVNIQKYINKYTIRKSDFVIIYAGRLSAEKGIDKLLKATSSINNENIVVLVVGSYIYNSEDKDSYYDELKALSKQKCKVIFTGYVPNNELPYLYNIADIAVLPSIWDEPAGLTMIEAMACGTPVITTNVGGIPEYVGNEAIIVKNDDRLVENLKKSILDLKNQNSLLEIGEKGAKRINELFSNEKYLDNLLEIIQ